MAKFKLVPLRNTAINKDGIEELIVQHNIFLHVTMATSILDSGTGDDIFKHNERDEKYDGSIHAWTMNTMPKNDTFFHLVEPGRKRKSLFLHSKNYQEETEA